MHLFLSFSPSFIEADPGSQLCGFCTHVQPKLARPSPNPHELATNDTAYSCRACR